jgi:hypothetical protein
MRALIFGLACAGLLTACASNNSEMASRGDFQGPGGVATTGSSFSSANTLENCPPATANNTTQSGESFVAGGANNAAACGSYASTTTTTTYQEPAPAPAPAYTAPAPAPVHGAPPPADTGMRAGERG